MKPYVHIAIAVLIGLISPDPRIGFWMAFAQVLPLADRLLKYIFQYQPLHTVWGFVVMVLLYRANLPFIYLYPSLMHLLHILLDITDGIQPLQPWSRKEIKY